MPATQQSKINKLTYRLQASLPAFRSREVGTLNWLGAHLRPTDYISWSGGKDSMVLGHLCRRVNPDLPILCSDSGVPFRWTEEDRAKIEEWCDSHGWSIRKFSWNKWGNRDLSNEQDEEKYREAVHRDQFTALNNWAQTNGFTRRIDGMRASEFGKRKIYLLTCRGVGNKALHPLWNWSLDDVWCYTVKYDIPWLSIYDHLGPAARNNLIGKSGSAFGRLAFLKKYYPDAFRLASDLFNARDMV